MKRYIYQKTDWPELTWDERVVSTQLAEARFLQGQFLGKVSSLDPRFLTEANNESLSIGVVASSAIEGEYLDLTKVKRSVASRTTNSQSRSDDSDPDVEGAVSLMWDATTNFDTPLTADRLFEWHRFLFPGSEGGKWRTPEMGTMRVVSERMAGEDRVHFEAPDADEVPNEMNRFVTWFENENSDPLLVAAVSHLRFLTVHPFHDGNGRIARAIAEYWLAKSDQSRSRYFSLSSQIEKERSEYYMNLELSQKGDTDITDWVTWFIGCFTRSIKGAEQTLGNTLRNADLWKKLHSLSPNQRQLKVIEKMVGDFKGKLSSSKYAKLAKCSQDTAIRDINALVEGGILVPSSAGGRSRTYDLAE